MNNLKIEVTINAPELVEAINLLAHSLNKNTNAVEIAKVAETPAPPPTAPVTTTLEPNNDLPPAVMPVATTAKEYTFDDLALAASGLMDMGKGADLRGLLTQFGIEAMPSLPQEQFGAFATALRGLGANI